MKLLKIVVVWALSVGLGISDIRAQEKIHSSNICSIEDINAVYGFIDSDNSTYRIDKSFEPYSDERGSSYLFESINKLKRCLNYNSELRNNVARYAFSKNKPRSFSIILDYYDFDGSFPFLTEEQIKSCLSVSNWSGVCGIVKLEQYIDAISKKYSAVGENKEKVRHYIFELEAITNSFLIKVDPQNHNYKNPYIVGVVLNMFLEIGGEIKLCEFYFAHNVYLKSIYVSRCVPKPSVSNIFKEDRCVPMGEINTFMSERAREALFGGYICEDDFTNLGN